MDRAEPHFFVLKYSLSSVSCRDPVLHPGISIIKPN